MTLFHKTKHLARRAFGGVRRRPWLHALSTITLAAAFLSFAATLTAARNLDALLARWVGGTELTVYLREGSGPEDLDRLAKAVTELEGVARVDKISAATARTKFSADLGAYGDMGQALPESAFPSSIDVHLYPTVSRDSTFRQGLAARVTEVEMVEKVEIYDDWFERLTAFSTMGRMATWGLGLLALVVAVLVVAATVRTGVSARKKEIEVLLSVGATDRYVRLPFLLEGALEAAFAMFLALLALYFMMNRVENTVGDILPLIGGGGLVRLTSTVFTLLLMGGMVAGIIGARLSLRRLEEA